MRVVIRYVYPVFLGVQDVTTDDYNRGIRKRTQGFWGLMRHIFIT